METVSFILHTVSFLLIMYVRHEINENRKAIARLTMKAKPIGKASHATTISVGDYHA